MGYVAIGVRSRQGGEVGRRGQGAQEGPPEAPARGLSSVKNLDSSSASSVRAVGGVDRAPTLPIRSNRTPPAAEWSGAPRAQVLEGAQAEATRSRDSRDDSEPSQSVFFLLLNARGPCHEHTVLTFALPPS